MDAIIIETSLQAFRPGMSSAKTLYSLASFNGVISYIAQDLFDLEPKFVSAVKARSSVGLKIKKNTKKTKDQVLDWVKNSDLFSKYNWPQKTLTRGPRKDQVIDDPSCFDIADAAVVALYYAI